MNREKIKYFGLFVKTPQLIESRDLTTIEDLTRFFEEGYRGP